MDRQLLFFIAAYCLGQMLFYVVYFTVCFVKDKRRGE